MTECAVVLASVPMCSTGDEACAEAVESEIFGTFMSCSDCRKYVVISQGKVITKSCQAGFGFNTQTKKCKNRSPHCFECQGRL